MSDTRFIDEVRRYPPDAIFPYPWKVELSPQVDETLGWSVLDADGTEIFTVHDEEVANALAAVPQFIARIAALETALRDVLAVVWSGSSADRKFWRDEAVATFERAAALAQDDTASQGHSRAGGRVSDAKAVARDHASSLTAAEIRRYHADCDPHFCDVLLLLRIMEACIENARPSERRAVENMRQWIER